VLMDRCFACLRHGSYSFALLALVGCGAVGACMGRRQRSKDNS